MPDTNSYYIEVTAFQRVSRLPLFDSALKSVVSVYTDIKGRYPLLGVVGGVAEIGLRSVSQAAIVRASPLLQSLEPQIEVVNDYACMGLDKLEKNLPVLHQSTEEVMGHLKEAFILTLDDVQERWEKLTDTTWYYLLALQDSQLGHMATSGLDNILTRSEEALATHMPLPPALRHEWQTRYRQFKDEDGDEEPRLWTRFRGLLLCLSLQLYHRLLKLRDQLEWTMTMLQDAADRVGLSRLLAVVSSMLHRLQQLYVSQVLRLEALWRLALDQLRTKAQVLADLKPVKQVLGLPAKVQQVVADLQELGKILVQLLINSTPLYNMIQQPSDEEVENYITQQGSLSSDTTRHGFTNSLFLKDLDGQPWRQKSSYTCSEKGSLNVIHSTPQKPDDQPPSHRGSEKQEEKPNYVEFNTTVNHPDQKEPVELKMETSENLSTNQNSDEDAELKVETIEDLKSNLDSGEAGESNVETIDNLRPNQDSNENGKPKVETTDDLNCNQDSDEAGEPKVATTDDLNSNQDSLKAGEPKVETTDDLNSNQDSDEVGEPKVETTDYLYSNQDSDEAGEPKVETSENLSPNQDSDETAEPNIETIEDLSPNQDSDEDCETKEETVEDQSSNQASGEDCETKDDNIEDASYNQDSGEDCEKKEETIEDPSSNQDSDVDCEPKLETIEDLSTNQDFDEAGEPKVQIIEDLSADQDSGEAVEHLVETTEHYYDTDSSRQ